MRKIILPGTDFVVPRFSFGTAGLFNVGSSRARSYLLCAAYDHGFTHFDTAPYYGFGVAERDLGDLGIMHRDVTITTKVGIYSPGGEGQREGAVFFRKAAGKMFPGLTRPVIDWSIDRARKSLSGSLRRLRRERVDLYLLHEPQFGLLRTEEWLRWLESEHDRVARFGIAVDTMALKSFVSKGGALADIIQTADSVDRREADVILNHNRSLQFTYGYLRAAKARAGGSIDIRELLRNVLARNTGGSVIISTGKVEHLHLYSKSVESVREAEADTVSFGS